MLTRQKLTGRFFTFNEVSKLFFYDRECEINSYTRKQITIPLPPKADKQELSEWPQVGDEVTWGSGHTGDVKSLSDEFAWVKRSDNSQYTTLYTSSLKKPKTPEEDLVDKIIEKHKHLTKHEQAYAIARDIVNNAIDKYNITLIAKSPN